MNTAAVYCVAALGVLLFGMGWPISALRNHRKQYFGVTADPTDTLYKAVRAHGNTAEYAAFLSVIFLYLGAHQPEPWMIWTMIAVTVCRYLFVIGMIAFPTVAKPNPLRFIGAAGTYTFGLALCYAMTIVH
jgi:uncharacterized membrane protein YecN with MAPEG domain